MSCPSLILAALTGCNRPLTLTDAVFVGRGSMIGAGVFAPAAAAAGSALLVSLVICVLLYYAIANASAWTLGKRFVPAVGLAGCLILAGAVSGNCDVAQVTFDRVTCVR